MRQIARGGVVELGAFSVSVSAVSEAHTAMMATIATKQTTNQVKMVYLCAFSEVLTRAETPLSVRLWLG